jgi:hypothetical protein
MPRPRPGPSGHSYAEAVRGHRSGLGDEGRVGTRRDLFGCGHRGPARYGSGIAAVRAAWHREVRTMRVFLTTMPSVNSRVPA